MSDPAPSILIIDDEPIVRESIAVYLEDSGLRVTEAGDGREGLQRYRSSLPDVVLVDLRMPEVDGLDVLSIVSRETPEIPVIVVSGTGVIHDAIEALRRGAWDFLTKPIPDLAVLEHTIRKAIERRRLLVENRRYREHLEAEVNSRTADLHERTVLLEKSNRELETTMAELLVAEDDLRRAKERLSLALEVTQHAIWDWNLQNNTAYFSPRYYTILGYEPHEKVESLQQWKGLLHPEDREETLKRIDDYLAGRISTYQTEFRMRSKQGRYRWILGRGKIVEWDPSGQPLRMIGTHVDITERKLSEEALRLSEANLRVENTRLKSTLKGAGQFGRLIGKSPVMQEVYETILKAATSRANVIIYGESGTGKELAAQTIHELSERSSGAFIAVNCGAIPGSLMESEFFGYKKGAFTGANQDRPGYLESAHGGTLFLDEVGELDLNMQVKLLRVIDGAGYMPVGSRQVVLTDVRFIAATNRDLQAMIRAGKFREDFFYRIHIVPIHMPPLRARKEDLTLLVRHFLDVFSTDTSIVSIPDQVQSEMKAHDWPGNVRELQNAIQRFVTLKEVRFSSTRDRVAVPTPPAGDPGWDDEDMPLRDVATTAERRHIRRMLEKHQWQRGRVAQLLGVNRRTLFRKMKDLGLD